MKANTEIIDKYLHNQLTEAEKKAFEIEMSNNDVLRKEVELQREIMQGIEQLGIRKEISQSIKKAKFNKLVRQLAIAATTIAVVVGSVYYMAQKTSENKTGELLHQLNEKNQANWSEADKALPSQLFKINAKRDTILETNAGIILQIQANTFLDKFGEVPSNEIELEVKEAMTAADIIKAGLSTTSNGQLLETGGMFYVNARLGEENLTMDQSKNMQVSVPSGTNKPMSLFEGERTKDGDINWINPLPMKKQLATVDITQLNFYPPHFLDSLAQMGFDTKNKKLTDSIYYSFGNYYTCGEEGYVPATVSPAAKTDTTKSINQGDSVPKKMDISPTSPIYSITLSSSNVSSSSTVKPSPNGEKIFKQNCAVCHNAHSDKMLTGPGLLNVAQRAPKGDWLMRYILNNEKLIKSGDSYANKIYKQYGKAAMTVFEGQLSEEDVKAVLNYIGSGSPAKIPQSQQNCIAEINPSRIRTIWDPKFNGTILATKEFEERLQVIFSSCNSNIFSLYADNLDKELYELDSLAAYVYGGATKEKFIEFMKRHDGGVQVTDEQSAELQKYLRDKRAIYDKAISDAMNKLYKNESDLANSANEIKSEYNSKLSQDQANLLGEEIEANLDEAYRQLGKKRNKIQINSFPLVYAKNYVTAPVTNPGWYNVDRYVIDATVNRRTLDYKDTTTGKQALIEYAAVEVKVNKYENYDKLVCYLLTDKLSSFQFMKDSAKVFRERLNQTFANSLIVVGYKDGKTFYWEEKYAKAKEYLVDLSEIDTETLTRRINMRYNFTGTENVIRNIDFTMFEHKEAVRVAKIEAREKLRQRIFKVVYPCKEYFPDAVAMQSEADVPMPK